MSIAFIGVVCGLMICTSSASAGGVIAVLPNGKIVVGGGAYPGFGMLARLVPDGRLDPSFGDDGFAVDHDSTPLTEMALQSDGKIIALNTWLRLNRYGADGGPDLDFGEDGVAVRTGVLDRPATVVPLPDGRTAVAAHFHIKMSRHDALVYVFSTDGRSVEQVGELTPSALIGALAASENGALLMAGSSSPSFQSREGGRSILARFVPGAGSPYDPAFGGGAGLVKVSHPGSNPAFNALVPTAGGIYAAGSAAAHIVLARFSDEGVLDGSFGSSGFADVLPGPGFSQANDLVIQPDGKVVVAGEVSDRKGWPGYTCTKCRPLILRFLPDGGLDPSFGSGGVVRLARANGGALRATAETVVALPDGRILVAGRSNSGRPRVLVSRLMSNGQIDRSFGDAGTATIEACPGRWAAQRRSRCLPSVRARLRVRRLPRRRVALRLNVSPNLDWARVRGISLTLPDQLQVIEERRQRIRATLVEEDGRRRSTRVAVDGRELSGYWTIGPRAVSLSIPASVLQRVEEGPAARRLPFRVKVAFGTRFFEYPGAGTHGIVLRRALG